MIYFSTRKDKKLMVKVGGEWVHFGQEGYEDYLEHGDTRRRAAYLARSAKIRDGSGRLTRNLPSSANYWARRVLWKSGEGYR